MALAAMLIIRASRAVLKMNKGDPMRHRRPADDPADDPDIRHLRGHADLHVISSRVVRPCDIGKTRKETTPMARGINSRGRARTMRTSFGFALKRCR